VPSLLRELQHVMTENHLSCPTLHTILTCGEALHLSDVRAVRTLFDEKTVIVNQYGPTECTMVSTRHVVSNPDNKSLVHIPIGRPFPKRTIYILDASGNLAPVGIPGELHIGGPLLARGYLNRPELTAECFIPDPFVGTGSAQGTIPTAPVRTGARLYKTG